MKSMMRSSSQKPESSISEQVYQKLKWSLIAGEFAPDASLSIRKVAETFGTSAMPVREALKRLASQRALVSKANRSFRVPKLNPKRVSELFFLRAHLEGLATELAVPNLSETKIRKLEKLATQTDCDISAADKYGYLTNNYSFHFTIYNRAGNDELVSIIEGLWVQSGPYLADVVDVLETSEEWRNLHIWVAQAIRSGDPQRARELIERDIGWGTKVYRQLAGGSS